MIWLTWRQFRVSALVLLAALAAGIVVLAVTGPQLADLLRERRRGLLRPARRRRRQDGDLLRRHLGWSYALPAVVGVFWGAPMVARELEAGTHRLVWTQSITRTRWLATKLGVAGVWRRSRGWVGLLLTWWCAPIDDAVAEGLRGQRPAERARGCGRRCSGPAASCRSGWPSWRWPSG